MICHHGILYKKKQPKNETTIISNRSRKLGCTFEITFKVKKAILKFFVRKAKEQKS